MKIALTGLLIHFLLISLVAVAQEVENFPEFNLRQKYFEKHLRFLASDELKGRYTGSEGNDIAAYYIAEQLQAYGVKPLGENDSYFQPIEFIKYTPASKGTVNVANTSFENGKNMLCISGKDEDVSAAAIWLGHGWIDEEKGYDDYRGKDVDGKIVVVASGIPGSQNRSEIALSMAKKRKWATERGAVGLIEIYQLNMPWQFFSNYFGKGKIDLAGQNALPAHLDTIPHVWVHDVDSVLIRQVPGTSPANVSITIEGIRKDIVVSNNVVGLIAGTDPELKDEYVLLSAHYDHVGVGEQGGRYTAEDSIFNGARDNGMGTVALLAAAKVLAEVPPLRSVIILALTGEEIGLLGSKYYADNPLVPLRQTIFNLNTDGAGYNDTSAISVIGYGRVGVEEELNQAAEAFGLKIYEDPAREQNLFDRSDNVSFAQKGIPAPTFSPGFDTFDQEIFNYYHQVTDEVDSINWRYLTRFAQAYAYTARLIANKKQRPAWKAGDKYEEAGKKLYGG